MMPSITLSCSEATFVTERPIKGIRGSESLYLQLDHPAVQDIFVRRGGAVGLKHVARVGHPVLQLLQPVVEQLVLGHDAVDP